MSSIKKFEAQEILDSMGYPTLRGSLILENGLKVSLDIPSPVFPSEGEPVALRDNEKRFLGYGMRRAAQIISQGVSEKLKGVSVFKQKEIDLWLEKVDSSKKKELIGVSTLLLVSLLVAKAAAASKNLSLFSYLNSIYSQYFGEKIEIDSIPTVMVTLINGGKRVNNPLDFKEYYLIPSSSFSFEKALEFSMAAYHKLKEVLEYKNISTSTADLGGFSPNIYSNLDAFELIVEAVLKMDLKLGVDFFLGVDLGAEDIYLNSGYKLSEDPQIKNRDEFYKFVSNFTKSYNVIYLEDIFSKKDLGNWKKFMQEFGEYNYVAWDYLDDYGREGYEKILKEKLGNTVVFKLLRYSNLTSLFKDINYCRKNNLSYVISQEVNETNQTFISDLAVALQASFIKIGAPVRGERVAKYNRLIEIQKEIKKK